MKNKRILKMETAFRSLKEEGYCIVPFLNNEEVEELKSFFYSNHNELPPGMYASSHASSFPFRKKMNEKIKSVCQRAMNETFQNITPLGSTFMVKSKGENGSLHPHQDWNIVDESKFNSYNIWLPLVDTDANNGTLMILPKSHLLLKNIRGLNIPCCFENVINEVWSKMIPINVNAGNALVYDHRLLHASAQNKKDEARLVIVYGIIPDGAEMLYYYGNGNEIEIYSCTPEFYFNEKITEGPTRLQHVKKMRNRNHIATSQELKAFLNPQNKIWKQLTDLFS